MIQESKLEDFKRTKFYQYLYENHQIIQDDGSRFNIDMRELITKETDNLAVVLKCHLIIEYYIDRFLQAAYPTISWDPLSLTFAKKLELINVPGTYVGLCFYKAIKKLNSIRNKFAHQLTYELKESDLTDLRQSMDLWEKARERTSGKGIKLVEEFTIWVCGNIDSFTNGIKRHTPEHGLPGYLAWLKQMNEPIDEIQAEP
jgi:hypothetical protein